MILWLLLGVAYLVILFTAGVMTFKSHHYVIFAAGFVIPLLWLVGAVIEPRRA